MCSQLVPCGLPQVPPPITARGWGSHCWRGNSWGCSRREGVPLGRQPLHCTPLPPAEPPALHTVGTDRGGWRPSPGPLPSPPPQDVRNRIPTCPGRERHRKGAWRPRRSQVPPAAWTAAWDLGASSVLGDRPFPQVPPGGPCPGGDPLQAGGASPGAGRTPRSPCAEPGGARCQAVSPPLATLCPFRKGSHRAQLGRSSRDGAVPPESPRSVCLPFARCGCCLKCGCREMSNF